MKHVWLPAILTVTLLASCAPKTTPTPAVTRTGTSTSTPTQTLTPTQTSIPTQTPSPTRTPSPAAAPTSMSVPLDSKSRPIPLGKTVTFAKGDHKVSMKLLEIRRGQAATDTINAGQLLQYAPAGGEEFLVARFWVKVESGPEEVVSFSSLDFAIEASGHLLATVFVALNLMVLNDDLYPSLYPGGEAQGWVPFHIPTDGEVGSIRYEIHPTGECIWFGAK